MGLCWFAPGVCAADWNICSDSSSTDGSGTLYDSGGALGNYGDIENCSFLISPSGSPSQITLSFSAFNVEFGFDKLFIYDGTTASSRLLGIYNGSGLPGDIIATSGSMYLVFSSDFSRNESGFAATWTSSGGPGGPSPDISLTRSVDPLSDPFNNTTNPKIIPGAVLVCAVTVTNQGLGTTDADTVIITNPVGSENTLFVGDLGDTGSGPVRFSNGATTSGLTCTFSSLLSTGDSISFSDDNGATYTYIPTADSNGYDSRVTHLRVLPSGVFAASDGTNHPSFTLQFHVSVR